MIERIGIKRRYGVLWYNLRCPHCRTDHWRLYLWIRLRFLFNGECQWHFHCPVCHKATTKRIMFNIVNDHTDKDERVMNGKKLWDDRIR